MLIRIECGNRARDSKPTPELEAEARSTVRISEGQTAILKTSAKAKVELDSRCVNADGTSGSSAYVFGKAKAEGKLKIKIKALAKAMAEGDVETVTKAIEDIQLEAEMSAKANASGQVESWCIDSGELPPPPPPPPGEEGDKNLPPIITVTDREHIFDKGGNAPWDAYASDPENNPVSYTVSTTPNATAEDYTFPEPGNPYHIRSVVRGKDVPSGTSESASITFCVSDNRDEQGNFDPAIDNCATDDFLIVDNDGHFKNRK